VEAELLDLCNVVDAIISSRKTGKVTRHYLLCNYVARWKAGIPTASDDAAAARFMSPSDLKDIDLWSETRKTIEMARRQLAASL
ncbi:MAG: phosphohydrolase, partial [Pseudomonadota bacterium]